MGFLKNLLNPQNAITGGGDPIKTATASLGLNGSRAPVSSSPTATPGAPTNPNNVDYFGDQSDPAFGSFTKPFDVEQFYNYADPGYAFQLQQGTQALQNSAAADSGALSGAALKDLLKYNQDYAGTAYNDAFNRYQTQQGNIFSRLASLLTLGQNAAAGTGTQGVGLAGQAGQAISNAGTASGAGLVGAGNAFGDGLTNYWLMRQFGGAQPRAVGTGESNYGGGGFGPVGVYGGGV